MTNAWDNNGVMCASSNGFLDIGFKEGQGNFDSPFSECHLMPTSASSKCNSQNPLNGLAHSGSFGEIKQCAPRVLCYSVPVSNYNSNYNSLYGPYNHTPYSEPVKPNYEATAPLNGIHIANLNSNMGHYPQSQMLCQSAYGIDHNTGYYDHRNSEYQMNPKPISKFSCNGSIISSDVMSYSKYGNSLTSCHMNGINRSCQKRTPQSEYYQNGYSLLDSKQCVSVDQIDERHRDLGLMHKTSGSPSSDEHNSSLESQSSLNNLINHPRTSSRCDSVRSETAESSCSSLSVDSQAEQILASINQINYSKSCEINSDLSNSKNSQAESFSQCLGSQINKSVPLQRNQKSPSSKDCNESSFASPGNWSPYPDTSCVNFNSFNQNPGVVINDFKNNSYTNGCVFEQESGCDPVTSGYFPSVDYPYCAETDDTSYVVSVPLGWKRLIFSESVVYTSPSGTNLRSLQDVCRYLLTEGTCKCGLQCPLRVDRTFNFDPKVLAKHSRYDPTEAYGISSCHHKHKPSAYLADGKKSLPKAGLSSDVAVILPSDNDDKQYGLESKGLKKDHISVSNMSPSSNLMQDKFHSSEVCSSLKSACNGSSTSEFQSLCIDQITHPFTYSDSLTQTSATPESAAICTDTLSFSAASPSTKLNDPVPVNMPSDENFMNLTQCHRETSSCSIYPEASVDCPSLQEDIIPPTSLSDCQSLKIKVYPSVTHTPVIVNSVADKVGLETSGKKRKIVKKPKNKYSGLLDRGSPCPNIDVRQIPPELNRPPPSLSTSNLTRHLPVSVPSFLENPNEYLAQQTAILRHAISPSQTTFAKTNPVPSCSIALSAPCPNTSGDQVKLSTKTKTVMSVNGNCLKDVSKPKTSIPASIAGITLPLVMTPRDGFDTSKTSMSLPCSKPSFNVQQGTQLTNEANGSQPGVISPVKKFPVISKNDKVCISSGSPVMSNSNSSVIVVGGPSASPATSLTSHTLTCCSPAPVTSSVPFIIHPVVTSSSGSSIASVIPASGNTLPSIVTLSAGVQSSPSSSNSQMYGGRHIICSVPPILTSVTSNVTTLSPAITSVPTAVTSVSPTMTQVIPTIGVTQVLGQPVQFVNTMTMPNVLIQGGSHNLLPQTLTLDCVNGSLNLPSNVNIQTSPTIQIPQMVLPGTVTSVGVAEDKSGDDKVSNDVKTSKKKSRKRKSPNQSIASLLHMNSHGQSNLTGQVLLPNVTVPPQNITQPMVQALTILPNGKPQMVLNQQPVAQFSSFSGSQLSHQLVASPSQQYFTSSHVNSLSSAVSPIGANTVGQINLIQPLNLFGNANSSALIQNLPIQQIVLPSLSLVSQLPDGTLIANDSSNATLPLQYQLQNIGGQALLSPVNVPLHNFTQGGASSGSLIATQNGMVVRMNSPQQISNVVFRQNEHPNGVRQSHFVGMNNGLQSPVAGIALPPQCTAPASKSREIVESKVSESSNIAKEQKTTFLRQNTTIVHQTTMLTNSGVTASQVSSQQIQMQSDVLTCSQTIVDHCPPTRNTVSGPQMTTSQESRPTSQISPPILPVPVPPVCDIAVTHVSQPLDWQNCPVQSEKLDPNPVLHQKCQDITNEFGLETGEDYSGDEMIIDVQIEDYETDSEDSGVNTLLRTDMMKKVPHFNVGDLVWGQIRGFPSWPGKVVAEDFAREHCPVFDKQSNGDRDGRQWVQWFGDHTITLVKSIKLKSLIKGLESYHKVRRKYKRGRKTHAHLETAVQEAISQLNETLLYSEDDELISIIANLCDNSARAGKVRHKKKKVH